MTSRRFLLRVMFSAKRWTIPAMVFFVACQIGESLVPVVMGVAIDSALATGDASRLTGWLAVLALVFVVIATGSRFSQQLVAMARQLVQHRLRATLSKRVLHPNTEGGVRPDGSVVSLMTNDVFRLSAVGLVVFPVGEVVAIVFIAVSLLVIHWPLGIVVLVGAPLVVWLMGAMSGQYARSSRTYQGLLAASVGRATDLVAGYGVIKGVRAEAEATARYRRASQEALNGAIGNAGRLARYLGGSGVVSGVFVAAVAALAGWFTIEGRMSVGELIAAAGLTQALIPQMSMVTGNAVPAWAAASASAGRVLDALRETVGAPHPAAERKHVADIAPVPTIEVSVPGREVIRIASGELVGLHADDTTSARIAQALLDQHFADDGGPEVHIDGSPSALVDHATYRSRVVVAPHDALLFSGTIADNLDLPARTRRSREAALHAAACEDFATGDRPIGDMGGGLSGGQRQRIALARALAADAPVLVLHDPTTAVDSVTETLIAGRLRKARAGWSTVLLASSPVLLGVCDRVVDLRQGASAGERLRVSTP
jgi:ABC-type multidrug transport system fused ATPase/permease subunit